MKKEDLMAQGLTEEQVNFVMAENGKDVKREQDKTAAAVSDRDTANQQLADVQTQLKAFEGIDVVELQSKVTALTNDISAKETAHQAALAKRDREAETATYLAGKKFVNAATREHYAAKINAALESPDNAGKNREDLLKAYTTGEDGKEIPNIYEVEYPNSMLNLPPMGPIEGDNGPVGIPSLHETQLKLNEHRLIK